MNAESSKKASSNRKQMNEHGVCFLHVHVYKGRDLAKEYETGVSETRVVLRLGGNHNKTTQTTASPNWNYMFKYPKYKIQAPAVEIELEGQSRSKAKYISLGKVVFDLEQLPTSATLLSPRWYRLRDRKGDIVTAELLLAIWIDGGVQPSVPPPAIEDNGDDQFNALVMGGNYSLPNFWYIRVHVIEAELLVPSYSFSMISAQLQTKFHVRAMLGNQSWRTTGSSSHETAFKLEWNEDFIFVACEPFEEPLVLTVEERGELRRSNQVCGRCTIPLKDLSRRFNDEQIASRWYDLSQQGVIEDEIEKQTKIAGRINVKLYVEAGYHVLIGSKSDSSDYVLPERTPCIGIIEFHVIEAYGLPPTKFKNGQETADAYCVVQYGKKWVRTKTIVGCLDPKWNEHYSWEVFDPCSTVTIGLFDDNYMGGDWVGDKRIKRFAKVRIHLSTLYANQQLVEHTYPIIHLEPSGRKTMGVIKVAVKLTYSSWDVLSLYLQPLLPKNHYLDPFQQDGRLFDHFNYSVKDIVCRWFDEAEPRIRRDVVQYMWAKDCNQWNLRKMKSNMSIFMDGMQWYDDMRSWKNPLSALLIHVFLVLLLLCPRILPSAIFLSLCLFVILNYRHRPQQPSDMDLHQSLFDIDPEELDEEFDTFFTTAPPHIVIERYDRLRVMASKIQNKMGDLVHLLEGCQILVFWTDPTAAKIFTIFCLIAAVVLYYVHLGVLFFVLGLYMVRHPRLSIFPSAPVNFISRLPSFEDRML